MNYTIDQLARFIDHTNLKPYATKEDIRFLCNEAKDYHLRWWQLIRFNQNYAVKSWLILTLMLGRPSAFL